MDDPLFQNVLQTLSCKSAIIIIVQHSVGLKRLTGIATVTEGVGPSEWSMTGAVGQRYKLMVISSNT